MPGSRAIKIPDEAKEVLSDLLELDDPEFATLCEIAKDTAPRLDSEAFSEAIAFSFAEASNANLSADQIKEIMEMAVQSVRASAAYGDVGNEVIDSLQQLAAKEPDGITEAASQQLRSRITSLIGIQSVIYTGIASVEMVSHRNTLMFSKIITDIRPLFALSKVGTVTEPKASVMIHQLMLRTRHNQRIEEIFVTLDDTDLEELKLSIESAIQKSKVLQAVEHDAGRIFISAD